MFVGRKNELKILNNLYNTDHFDLIIITGRRRIGKSTLLSKFIQNKPCIFFNAVEGNEALNLELLSQAYLEFEHSNNNMNFSSYLDALETIFKKSVQEKFVFIIDEFPYLVNAYKPVSSILQMLIDKYKSVSKMKLILSGSSISFMENEVLAYKAPLFGRKTAQLKLEPLTFYESFPYFKNFSNEEKIEYYSIYGGTPYYLNQIDIEKSLEGNLKRTFLNNSSFLNDEPLNLLKQEVIELSSYYSILNAIASGATKLSEIASKTNLSTALCTKIIKNLIELGLVFKEYPYGENKSKKTLYKLSDNAFKFWFRFIPSNISLISRGINDQAYLKIRPFLNEYIGPIFEEISKEYLWNLLVQNKSPVKFNTLGRWWGTNPKTKTQIEIDIVGEENKECALFAECKWTNEKVDSKVIKDLIEKSQVFPHIIKHYYIFSKNGFTTGAYDLAEKIANIHLVDLNEIININASD